MKRYFVIGAFLFAALLCLSGCRFLIEYFLTNGSSLGDVKISITVSDLSQSFALGQAATPDGAEEYLCGVVIDGDNDPATGGTVNGDPGYEMRVVIRHSKSLFVGDSTLGGHSSTSEIIECLASLWNQDSGAFDAITSISPRAFDALVLSKNTIHLFPEHDYVWIVDPDFRSMFFTQYYVGGVPVNDFTSFIRGNSSVSDSVGEAGLTGYGFIDIVAAEIDYPPRYINY